MSASPNGRPNARVSASTGLAAAIAIVMAPLPGPAFASQASVGRQTPQATDSRPRASVQSGGPEAPSPKPAPVKTWTTPRTPWGDPDLQGNFTNKYEQGTPFERPDEFAGRKIDDLKSEELKDILQERQDRALLSITLAGGDPAGNLGGPLWWQDQFEVNKGSRPWFVVDPTDGKIPPMTQEAQRRIATRAAAARASRGGGADSYTDRSLYDRCITRGLPGSMMPVIYGNSYQIVQGPGYVAIRYEMVHETRVIPLDGRPHVGSTIRSHMGDARGHWAGNTLVVETTNFRAESVYRNGNPATLKLVERFTRTAPNRVEWVVTVDDPATWTRPWTFAMPLTMNDEERIMEYACHEGNRAMENILSAARAEEEAVRKGLKSSTSPVPTAAEGER
jgi:hypothetical protein